MGKVNKISNFKHMEIISKILGDDGVFPNNAELPLLLFRDAMSSVEAEASNIERVIRKNGWGGSWRNGIYPFHHYHSTAHEVLGVFKGEAVVQFGGEEGPMLSVKAGDFVIIPAGVAHRNHTSSQDFRVVGAYPPGQSWDMNYGKDGERPAADENISAVPLPEKDPVFGDDGPLIKNWKQS